MAALHLAALFCGLLRTRFLAPAEKNKLLGVCSPRKRTVPFWSVMRLPFGSAKPHAEASDLGS